MWRDSEIKIRKKYASEYAEKYGKTLYHYTSIEAFYGMISNGEFWWGNTAAMNDKSELTDFINRLREALRRDSNPNKEALRSLFHDINARVKTEYPFTMSFSMLSDDAAQWERYSRNASGVRIAFNTEALVELFFYHDVIFNKVFYKYDIRNHEHYKTLKKYLETGEIDGFSTIDGVIENIILCAALHKHESFNAEAEVRLLSLPKAHETNLLKNCSELSYKVLGGAIKKVLKVDFSKLCENEGICKEDLFSDVMIGPRSPQSQNDLKEFCQFYRYEKLATKITVSKCPLRYEM